MDILAFIHYLFFPDYTISISDDARIKGIFIIDESVPSKKIKINQVGTIIFKEIEKNDRSIRYSRLLSILKEKYPAIPLKVLNDDISKFLYSLNFVNLINYKNFYKFNFIKCFMWNFVKFIKGYKNRYDLKGYNLIFLLIQVIIAVFDTYLLIGIFLFYMWLFIIFICIYYHISSLWVFDILGLIMGLFLSVAIHETIHVYTYRKIIKKQTGYLSSKMLMISFVREILPLKQSLLVRVSGPFITALLGGALFIFSDRVAFKVFSSVFIFHVVNLLPIFGDGYSLITDLFDKR
ncbi:MAG: hypothetical protein LBS28_04340 [Streptococcaceae bacterium]|jgi:hypothetical protein|nr:hypothetical protein [Streptococcaceae bacterium]